MWIVAVSSGFQYLVLEARVLLWHPASSRFSVIILAIATKLPEKFVDVMSSYRGHTEILVANCLGGDDFLLALYAGVIILGTKGTMDGAMSPSRNRPSCGALPSL